MTLQRITICFVNKTSVCIIRRTAGLLGPIYQNNDSNTIFISVQLALRWYLFTLPSSQPFSHTIRHSTSTAHTSSFHHSTRTCNHSTYSPHVCHHSTDITHVINTHNTPQPICKCLHSTNTPKSATVPPNTPHACHPSTSTPPTRISSFCHTPYLLVTVLTTCHHSTSTPHFTFH